MDRKLTNTIVTGGLVCLGLVSDAVSGTVVRLSSEIFVGQPVSSDATIYLETSRLRIDSKEDGGNVSVIYMATGEKGPFYWLIDFNDSSYVEIWKSDLVEARKGIEEAVKAAKRRMEGMPPDQRKQTEEMLADRFGAFFQPDIEYKKISSGATVRQWTCDHFQGFRDSEKVEEVWAADLKQLGMEDKDLKALREMAELFETVGQSLPAFFRFGGEKSEGSKKFPGFAVMMVSYEHGQRTEKWEITDVRRETLDAGLFKLPKGMKKKEAPAGR